MIHTFKFKSKFSAENEYATLGTIPAGRILKSEPIFEGGEMLWLIVVDDDPDYGTPQELFERQREINLNHRQ